jgi:hypothetical protein
LLARSSAILKSFPIRIVTGRIADLLQVAEKDGSGRDWARIRAALAVCISEEQRPTTSGVNRTVYRVRPELAEELVHDYIYVEQGRSGKTAARQRPLFEQMKHDAAARKFDRLLVWKTESFKTHLNGL